MILRDLRKGRIVEGKLLIDVRDEDTMWLWAYPRTDFVIELNGEEVAYILSKVKGESDAGSEQLGTVREAER